MIIGGFIARLLAVIVFITASCFSVFTIVLHRSSAFVLFQLTSRYSIHVHPLYFPQVVLTPENLFSSPYEKAFKQVFRPRRPSQSMEDRDETPVGRTIIEPPSPSYELPLSNFACHSIIPPNTGGLSTPF